jgi:hypothetical protein
MGEAMMRTLRHPFYIAALASWVCTGSYAQIAPSGSIAADDGGAPGYQHSVERSRFVTGSSINQVLDPVREFGFSKVVGPNGVFATNIRNGLVIATQSGGMDKSEVGREQDAAKSEHLLDPNKHNAVVTDYFVTAGIPRNQIGSVHANTYLSASGARDDPTPVPKVDGYASILERVLDNKFLVAESVAWARLDNEGQVVTEWVYWPAIPAKVLAEARRLEELTVGSRKEEFLARLPATTPRVKCLSRAAAGQ